MTENVPLSRYTTLGTGGPARWFAEPTSVDELVDRLGWAAGEGLPVAVVGLGSNLLVADEGFPGLALKLAGDLAKAEVVDGRLVGGGGAPLAVCLHRARAAELGGIEFVCAIPGTVGGGVWMNAGAYGGDIAGVLERALVADAEGTRWLTPTELGLEYRSSGLRHGQVVARAELRLEPRPLAEIKATVAEMQARRKDAQPTNKRTFGSVFKNPEHELTAGRMLEACCAARPPDRRRADLAEARELHRERRRGDVVRGRGADRRGPAPRARAVRCAPPSGGAAPRRDRDSATRLDVAAG